MNIARHPELLDRLAAAWAVGTLHGGARRRFEQQAREHATVRTAALLWQERMSSLTELQPGVQPPPEVWTRIHQQVQAERAQVQGRAPVPRESAAPWWQRLGLWQGMGLTAKGLPSPRTAPSAPWLAFQRCKVRKSMPTMSQAGCSRAPAQWAVSMSRVSAWRSSRSIIRPLPC